MKCFVIMPFGSTRTDPEAARRSETIFSDWIRPAIQAIPDPSAEGATLDCSRADRSCHSGDIIDEIVASLCDCDIVIADLSGLNPNVFYELGVQHAVRNGTILIAESSERIPFDLDKNRVIRYEYRPEGRQAFQRTLTEYIRSVIQDPGFVDNRVRKHLLARETDRIQASPLPPGFQVMEEMAAQLSRLQESLNEQSASLGAVLDAVAVSNVDAQQDALVPPGIGFLEGVWESSLDGTITCITESNGQLVGPYSYGNSGELSAYCYGFERFGDLILCRFEWIEKDLQGQLLLRIESPDELFGGWWLGIKKETTLFKDNPLSALMSVKSFVRTRWHRIGSASLFPPWATAFISNSSLDAGRT